MNIRYSSLARHKIFLKRIEKNKGDSGKFKVTQGSFFDLKTKKYFTFKNLIVDINFFFKLASCEESHVRLFLLKF